MTWFDDLHAQVTSQGQRPHVLHNGAGRLLVCEHGARVLACELPGVDHNLFFHTDRTADDGGPGMVTGGDRLWIAPEVAYFWPTLDDALNDPKGTAETPAAIDPGDYVSMLFQEPEEQMVTLFNQEVVLSDVRNTLRARFNVLRTVSLTAAPCGIDEDLSIISFSIINAISALFPQGEDPERDIVLPTAAPAGAWDILQVPPTGTLVCPTVSRPEVRSYYEPFGDRHLAVYDGCVRLLIDGRRRVKMGLRAEHTTGRMGYHRPLDEQTSTMIVRIFAPLPGEPYADIPRDDPRNRQLERGETNGPILGGDCLQAYNDDGDAFGGGPNVTFGEMEYHDPCVIDGERPTSRSGTCVTHVIAGPDDAVRAAGRTLLGVEVGAIE
ncbi:MAG: hypothetical protein AAF750_18575 [Planctomycetota bacterium]